MARSRLMLAAGFAAGIVVSGAVAVTASIPDSTNGRITGCYKSTDGTLRVIDAQAGQRCRSGEVKLVWNQTGPRGPQGPKGDTGARGPRGYRGPEGPAGERGPGSDLFVVKATTRAEIFTSSMWVPLPTATLTVPASNVDRTVMIEFWTSTACFGIGEKYVRLIVNGVHNPAAPLVSSQQPIYEELATSIVTSTPLASGATLNIAVEVLIETGSSCVFTEDHWHLSALAVE